MIKLDKVQYSEQRRIVGILSTVDKKLELERKRKEKMERVKKGLMNELLTGRNRVKVNIEKDQETDQKEIIMNKQV